VRVVERESEVLQKKMQKGMLGSTSVKCPRRQSVVLGEDGGMLRRKMKGRRNSEGEPRAGLVQRFVGRGRFVEGSRSCGVGTPSYGVGNPSFGVGNQSFGVGNRSFGVGNPSFGVGNRCFVGGNRSFGVDS
jgi:hypothetical protein